MDRLSKAARSKNMAAIKSRDTKVELFVRKLIFNAGFRYRLYDKTLPGHPDLVLKKYRTVIFINGCFWHGHNGCKKAQLPEDNRDFWAKKINCNRKRDKLVSSTLLESGFRVLIIWQCACLKSKQVDLLNLIKAFLKGEETYREIGRRELEEYSQRKDG